MRTRYLTLSGLLAASGSAALGACATADEPNAAPHTNVVLASDAGADSDAAFDAGEAAPCADCEYFPETCSDGVLCPNWPADDVGEIDPRLSITAVRGRSRTDVWVVGALGNAARFDGTKWTLHGLQPAETIRALWLRESGEISGVALERLFSRGLAMADGGVPTEAWTARKTLPHQEYARWSRTITSGWASPGAEWLWATTENTCFFDFGNRARPWPECSFDTSPSSGLWRVRTTASSDVEIGDAIGKDLCRAMSCGSMTSVHGSSVNALWAVGHAGAAIRVTDADGANPKIRAFNSQTLDALHGVWEATPPGADGVGGEAWAVGAAGVIRHYKGDPAVWDVVENVLTTVNLRAVWGSSASDVWAVGDAATVLHYDGTSWSRVKIAGLGQRRPDLYSVWISEPGDVWVAGHGVVLNLGGKP